MSLLSAIPRASLLTNGCSINIVNEFCDLILIDTQLIRGADWASYTLSTVNTWSLVSSPLSLPHRWSNHTRHAPFSFFGRDFGKS
jgi:hypothetical protein